MPSFHHLLIHNANEIRTITMNRPEKRNALCPLLMQEITQALDEAEDSDCRVVILTGAGPAFCAGLDMEHLSTLHATTEEEDRRDSENMANVLRTLYEFSKPVIAAVNGPAIAGGMGLAMLADFTLAVPEAKFGFTEVKLGYVPAIVASFLLRQVGEKVTRELLISGRLIRTQEAYHLGVVTQIVNAEELMQTAYACAQGLLQNSPQAMREVKRLLAMHSKRRLDEEIEDAIEVNAHQHSAEDFREGVQAFLKHRKPEWPSLHTRV
ncbi:enoyl-CoA hydratase/isomerase family protein [Terracidiphilus sp.]|jgi:methylglutaconyl-CoA hydratase|uniref:enoyl-CoA hydratase/isomerase family protein n=1 Tax=Terracidiphilus sp. TaxID=1964191 RepID=UPI003C1AC3C9